MHGLGPRDVQDLDRVVEAVSFGVQEAALVCEPRGADVHSIPSECSPFSCRSCAMLQPPYGVGSSRAAKLVGGFSEHRVEDESVLRERLSMLGRQKWIVLLAVIVVPLIAFVVSGSQRRLYQASVTVLVSEQNPTAAALNLTAATSSPPDRYATTQAALARAGIVAQMAVRAAKVPGRTAGELLANSSVSAKPNADLLAFSVSDPVPAVAERLAFAYATQFKVYRHRLDTETLTVALAEVRRRLDSIAASGATESPLFRSLTDSYRALQSLQTLQVAGASTMVLGRAGGASLVQPKTSRNLILGILVGLALGIGLAFLREALDTRVHSADELQARLGFAPARPSSQAWPPPGPGRWSGRPERSRLVVPVPAHSGSSRATWTRYGRGGGSGCRARSPNSSPDRRSRSSWPRSRNRPVPLPRRSGSSERTSTFVSSGKT